MIRIGITGQAGFIGGHLSHEVALYPDEMVLIPFEDGYFEQEESLRRFVTQCDVIVHLAALNRHPDLQVIYQTNIRLVEQLIVAMQAEKAAPYILFSSSTQEEFNNEYGSSKRQGRQLLEEWALHNGASFTGMIVPNVYGPFGRPGYNSFVATFCYQLAHDESPRILQDNPVRLIYVGSLCRYILEKIRLSCRRPKPVIERETVPYDFEKKVTEVLALLECFRDFYFKQGIIPALKDRNEVNLFNTFGSYLDPMHLYPRKLICHMDKRGMFVETIKLGIGGQVSFSTTLPGITRGNHFHTRKIERFTVIRGKARIQLRRVGTDQVLDFFLNGEEPAYVDMPVWYTHNITNVGEEELYTQFWINEWYDADDGDTYFEPVEK